MIKLKMIKNEYKPNYGMDLTQYVRYVNFDVKIHDIISDQFKKQKGISDQAVEYYLLTRNKFINRFNHTMDDVVFGRNRLKLIGKNY